MALLYVVLALALASVEQISTCGVGVVRLETGGQGEAGDRPRAKDQAVGSNVALAKGEWPYVERDDCP